MQEYKPYRGELAPSQAAAAMQAARLNAIDLLQAAEVLFDLKRFAHSMPLATLAIEESGKVPLLLAILLGFGDRSKLWRSYRVHRAKTADLNLGIEARIRVHFPEISADEAREIGQRGPTPDDLENVKQLSLYSDCLEAAEGLAVHLPRNIDWQSHAWDRLNEARAVVHALRDYPPEELEVWIQHAKRAQAIGQGYTAILRPLHEELLEKGFIKQGQWEQLLARLAEDEAKQVQDSEIE